ncbi:hypothetical protein BH09BAC4_BH09BAC4_38790 [soil metagenome]
MKKLIWMAAIAVTVLTGNAALANSPSQDKPVSTTTTTTKKSTPVKATTSSSKSTHSKHVKKAG